MCAIKIVEQLDQGVFTKWPLHEIRSGLLQVIDEYEFNEHVIDCIQHTLGFLRLRLLGREDGSGLYLHFWNGVQPIDSLESIHNHMCELTSLVVFGSVENRVYDVKPDDNGQHVRSLVHYKPNGGSVRVCSDVPVSCQLISCERICNGNYYDVSLDQFHTSELVTTKAITLVRKGPAQRKNPEVLTLRGKNGVVTSLDEQVDINALRSFFDDIRYGS